MRPKVSIIVPCYNEEATIGALLTAIHQQTYPLNLMEVVIADGLSTDGTRGTISRFQGEHPDLSIQVVDNAKQTIPSGLNQAIGASKGEVIVRLDAHSAPIPGYVERCVSDLQAGRGSSVGGVWTIVPGGTDWIARGIAAAAAHPLGAGDALYRLGGREGAVDTVPFGAFRKELIAEIGPFDESLLTNEDYEFNVRVRRADRVIWLDPEIRSTYVARSSLAELTRQYWRYGYWKCQMLKRYPKSLRWRQAIPPLFVLGLLVLALASIVWQPAMLLLALAVGLYAIALVGAAIDMARKTSDAGLGAGGLLALAVMHLSWGTGFWWGLVKSGGGHHG